MRSTHNVNVIFYPEGWSKGHPFYIDYEEIIFLLRGGQEYPSFSRPAILAALSHCRRLSAGQNRHQKQTAYDHRPDGSSPSLDLHDLSFLSVCYIALSAVRHLELRSSDLFENPPYTSALFAPDGSSSVDRGQDDVHP